MAYGTLAGFDKIWSSHEISLKTKVQVLHTCVFSVLMYAAETWTIRKTEFRRLDAFEMQCYRRLLGIHWFHHITNEEVLRRVNPSLRLNQLVKKRKLGLFGHICRMNHQRLIKVAMWGIVEGRNRRGRPRTSWTDNIKEWCQTSLHEATRWAADRQLWRNITHRVTKDTNG